MSAAEGILVEFVIQLVCYENCTAQNTHFPQLDIKALCLSNTSSINTVSLALDPTQASSCFRLSRAGEIIDIRSPRSWNILKIFLHIFPDYVVQIKCQHMSHAVKHRHFCRGRNFRHLSFLGLKPTIIRDIFFVSKSRLNASLRNFLPFVRSRMKVCACVHVGVRVCLWAIPM
jgi:hypothetical protein